MCVRSWGWQKKNVILFTAFFLFFLFFERARHAALHQQENSPFADTTERDEPFSNLNFEENRSKTNKTHHPCGTDYAFEMKPVF